MRCTCMKICSAAGTRLATPTQVELALRASAERHTVLAARGRLLGLQRSWLLQPNSNTWNYSVAGCGKKQRSRLLQLTRAISPSADSSTTCSKPFSAKNLRAMFW